MGLAHHEPFQYFRSTQLAAPVTDAIDMIGKTDQAKHQYALSDFWAAVDNGSMPAFRS